MADLKEHGYETSVSVDTDDVAASRFAVQVNGSGFLAPSPFAILTVSPLPLKLGALIDLSKQVEHATLRLNSLQNLANFEDLVDPVALQGKVSRLLQIEDRIRDMTSTKGKEQLLAFLMRNEASDGQGGCAIAIEASKQDSVAELFETMALHLANEDALLESVSWGSSNTVAGDLKAKMDTLFSALTAHQARYMRVIEASESFTAALEKTL